MAECDWCDESIEHEAAYQCNYCGDTFCGDHRLPEKHRCIALMSSDTLGPNFVALKEDPEAYIGSDPTEADEAKAESGDSAPITAADSEHRPNPDGNGDDWKDPTGECNNCGDPTHRQVYCNDCRKQLLNDGQFSSSGQGYENRNSERSEQSLVDRDRREETEDARGGFSILNALKTIVLLCLVVGLAAALVWGGSMYGEAAIAAGGDAIEIVGDVLASSFDPGTESLNTTEAELLIHEEVNERRQAHGLAPLRWYGDLANDARDHSFDMEERDFFAHENPDGEGPSERATVHCRVGENIAQTYWQEDVRTESGIRDIDSEQALADQVVTGWMNSPGHRENILTEHYVSEGIGVVTDGDEVYVTQQFCVG